MTLNWFQIIASTIAITFGLFSIFLTIISVASARHEAEKMTRAVKDEALRSAFASSDIAKLGRFLRDSMEQISVFQYVNSSAVADRTDKFLKHLADQVSLEPTLEVASTEDATQIARAPGEEFQQAYREMLYGELWNTLARLRRLLETELRTIAQRYNLSGLETRTVGTVVTLLQRMQVIPANVATILREILSVCNRGIHGLDVSAADAERAINLASDVFAVLQRLASGSEVP